ncbi:hypothetical protein ACO2XV_20715 [Escherichia coli]
MYAESGLVTTVGVKDLVVVQTKDAVLIADRNADAGCEKSGRADQSRWSP